MRFPLSFCWALSCLCIATVQCTISKAAMKANATEGIDRRFSSPMLSSSALSLPSSSLPTKHLRSFLSLKQPSFRNNRYPTNPYNIPSFREWQSSTEMLSTNALFKTAREATIDQYQLMYAHQLAYPDDSKVSSDEMLALTLDNLRTVVPTTTEEKAVYLMESHNHPMANDNRVNAINRQNKMETFIYIQQLFKKYSLSMERMAHVKGKKEDSTTVYNDKPLFVMELQPLIMYLEFRLKLLKSLFRSRPRMIQIASELENIKQALYYFYVARLYVFNADNLLYATIEETFDFLRTADYDMNKRHKVDSFFDIVKA